MQTVFFTCPVMPIKPKYNKRPPQTPLLVNLASTLPPLVIPSKKPKKPINNPNAIGWPPDATISGTKGSKGPWVPARFAEGLNKPDINTTNNTAAIKSSNRTFSTTNSGDNPSGAANAPTTAATITILPIVAAMPGTQSSHSIR